MGGKQSSEARVSSMIEKELRRSKKRQDAIVKVLLRGTSESGKTTFMKQLEYEVRCFQNDYLVRMKFCLIGNILEGNTIH